MQFFPGVAAVGRIKQAASRTTAGKAEGVTQHLPHRCIEFVGASRHEVDIVCAGVLIDVKDFFPGSASVPAAKHAAVLAGPVIPALRGYQDDVGIFRVDYDAACLSDPGQSHMLPGGAGIDGFIDPVTVRIIAPRLGVAGGDVNNVRVGRRNGNVTDSAHRLAVKNRKPGDAAIGRFPDTTGSSTKIIGCRITTDPGNPGSAPTAHGTNQSIAETAQFGRINLKFSSVNGVGD